MVTWSRLPVPIAMVNAWLTVPPPAESVTCTVNELVPALVGVPDRTNSPYSLSNVRPAGRLALLTAHVYSGASRFWSEAPPVGNKVASKPARPLPAAREQTPPAQGSPVVVIASGGVVAALAAADVPRPAVSIAPAITRAVSCPRMATSRTCLTVPRRRRVPPAITLYTGG